MLFQLTNEMINNKNIHNEVTYSGDTKSISG